jgi:hypothetical protein
LKPTVEDYEIQDAMELSRHTSSKYIWRYVKPPKEQIEQTVERLFYSEGEAFVPTVHAATDCPATVLARG